ncbi:MAG TPA: EAL domain-containing protein [Caldimonas sp.]|nr:EAL domain-containing protein [Caldimonas sp.]
MDAVPPLQPGAAAPAWETLPGQVVLIGPSGEFRGANTAFVAAFGGGEAARAWMRHLTPASRKALLEASRACADFSIPLRLDRPPTPGGETVGGAREEVELECAARWQPHERAFVCLLHDVSAAHRAQVSLEEQARLFRLLADNVPVLIAYYGAGDLRCRFANRAYAEAFGLDEQSIIGRTVAEVIGSEAAARIEPQVRTIGAHKKPVVYERTITTPDGGTRWMEVHLLPHLDEAGKALGTYVLMTDITRHRDIERALRESEERLAKFMQATEEGIVFHKDGVIVDANPPMCRLMGYRLEELVGHRTIEFSAPDELAKVQAVIASGQETTYESVIIDKQGQRIPVEFIVRTMVRNGEAMRMTIVRDIRDRVAAQARIHHMAHHDALTGLPNRMSFMERLEQSMLAAQTHGTGLALLFVDLDHFKRVNDSLGHVVGDALLRTVAARIIGALRSTDVVARFGGDEFMVLVPGLPANPARRADVEQVAHKLLAVIEAPVHAEGRPLSVTPSIGIALYPGDGDTPMELIEHADSAMYRAKARGRANHQFFDPVMATSAYAALVMEGELGQALDRGEFELYFQPQVRADDGVLVGAEALIRWNHPARGLLLPDEFIPVAEQRRLMLPIGQWVLKEAARCAVHWQALGLGVAPVAVNLSTVQFHSIGFIDAVAQVLPSGGIGHGLLELELTERMLMDDLAEVKQRLVRLKAMGLRISVDDFGTGYSSLGHLKELPLDKVKIDRSFVHDLPLNRDSAAITRAIVQMGHSLDITVIAEGVENAAQARFLSGLGCDELQGTWVGAPMPQREFEEWVGKRRSALREAREARGANRDADSRAARVSAASSAASSPAASPGARARR